jgi:hypothetical protein
VPPIDARARLVTRTTFAILVVLLAFWVARDLLSALRANELARCILHLATEGERDPVRLHDHALAALAPAMTWREPQPSELRT